MTARFLVGLVYKFNQKIGKIEDVIGIALSVLTPQGQSEILQDRTICLLELNLKNVAQPKV